MKYRIMAEGIAVAMELRNYGKTDLRNYGFTEERDKRIIETTADMEIGRSFFI